MYVITEPQNLLGFGEDVFNLLNPIAQKGDYKIIPSDYLLNGKVMYELRYKDEFVRLGNTVKELKNEHLNIK